MKKLFKFNPPKEPYKIVSYISKYKGKFIVTALAGIIFNSAIVLGPIFQGKLLDVATTAKGYKEILVVGLQFIFITLGFQIARFFKRYFVRDMANRISGDMRIGIMSSILGTDINQLQDQKVGDMMTKTIGDVDIVVEAIRKTITELWDTWVLMIAYFVALLIYDPRITLIAAIPIPLAIVAAQMMKKIVHKKNKEARKATSTTTLQIRKLIIKANVLRLYGREEAELKRLEKNLETQANKTAIASVLKNGLAPIYSAIATLGIIIVIALGSKRVIEGQFTIGMFTAYITMFTALATRTTTAAKVFNIQQGARISWERVKALMGNKLENKSEADHIEVEKLRIENLSFSYGDNGNWAIENINFQCERGMIVGVTGAVGSGKSALSLALTGLYNYHGNIYVDHRELRDLSNEEKIAIVSYSGHKQFLFSNSIEENITWGDIEEEKLSGVIKSACLNEDIENFNVGVKTEVGEKGIKVSGGQKQRISLARALYKDSSILILDDPFSAVDMVTERALMKEIREAGKNKIVIIFSHRLENFKFMDKIFVLQKGKIVEGGTHESLIEKEGIYKRIIESQKFVRGN